MNPIPKVERDDSVAQIPEMLSYSFVNIKKILAIGVCIPCNRRDLANRGNEIVLCFITGKK